MIGKILLLTPLEGEALADVVRTFAGKAEVTVLRDLPALEAADLGPSEILVSYGSGVIVPADLLQRTAGRSYNFHAGSPQYPGRDPHHFAIYDGVGRYGATLHRMTDTVDDGPILDVEWFEVAPGTTPVKLLEQANAAMFVLLLRNNENLLSEMGPAALAGMQWGPRKTTRALFRAMCRVHPTISREEFERRMRAFDGGVHDNLTLDMHGWTFRIDKSIPPAVADQRWAEFTTESYRELIRSAKRAGYAFFGYEHSSEERHVLWRHDVDMSVHRAAGLAAVEEEEGVAATYFLNPHSSFYNLLEPEILALARSILAKGHAIGLHFDAEAYAERCWDIRRLERALRVEQDLLERFLSCKIAAFSYHNPDWSNLLDLDDDFIGGMANAYGRTYRTHYGYVSDSNGYWRFKPIGDVISTAEHRRLQVLTHPEWWVPVSMAPRQRVERCAIGRAERTVRTYDDLLARAGRSNLAK
ncbi:MAG TPA: formyltransferase family protein [Stellaceae bacterium]|nr:formyltransferase family protein [Stellaceae bacterium]